MRATWARPSKGAVLVPDSLGAEVVREAQSWVATGIEHYGEPGTSHGANVPAPRYREPLRSSCAFSTGSAGRGLGCSRRPSRTRSASLPMASAFVRPSSRTTRSIASPWASHWDQQRQCWPFTVNDGSVGMARQGTVVMAGLAARPRRLMAALGENVNQADTRQDLGDPVVEVGHGSGSRG